MPIWYYNQAVNGFIYWIDYRKLSKADQSIIAFDDTYNTERASLQDAAWQAWQKGFVTRDKSILLDEALQIVDIEDNYQFVRRYFAPFWALFIFLIRVFSLHNPIKEVIAFWSSRRVQKIDVNERHYDYSSFEHFDSPLIKARPHVSVIIPTLNRYQYLRDALHDLTLQDYANFEIIIIDQSQPFNAQFYSEFTALNITVINQKERLLWKARNTAIKISKGEYILLYDDDSRVGNDWISNHLKCIDFFKCDISSGISLSRVGAKIPRNYSYFRWGDQLDTGNAFVKRDVFKVTGLFDTHFEGQRMGDGEFGIRSYLKGFLNISNPKASRIHLKVVEGGLREMGSWDSFRPRKFFSPRPIPSVLYLTRKYFGVKLTFLFLLQSVPPSVIPYKYKANRSLLFLGSILSCLFFPVILYQVALSWRLSGRMLKAGEKIEYL